LKKNIIEEKRSNGFDNIPIPAKPKLLIDLHIELNKTDISIKNIAKIITHDPALSLEILKVVNSAFLGLPQKVISIAHAISLLGINTTVNIFTSYLLKSAVDKSGKKFPRFWDESFFIAQVSVFLARKLSFHSPDIAYALGLFHNMGIPVLGQISPDFLQTLSVENEQTDGVFTDLEDEKYDTNHAVIAAVICDKWGLPESIIDIILNHHDVDAVLLSDDYSDDDKLLMCILKIAEHFSNLQRKDDDVDWFRFKNHILKTTGYDELAIDALFEEFVGLGIAED